MLLQSVSVAVEGLTLTGVGHAPAPSPDVFTATTAEDVPSLTVIVPPVDAEEGLVLRMESTVPVTLALRLLLLGIAVYVPEPPKICTDSALEQVVRLTVAGLTDRLALPLPQLAAPAPVPFTVIGTVVLPSDTVTVPPANAPEGFARRMDRTFPLTDALTLPLLEDAT